MKRLKIFLLLIAVISVSAVFLSSAPHAWAADAATGSIFDKMKQNIGMLRLDLHGTDDKDPLVPIAVIINVLMGFLGIFFFILIIYAGVLWMSAAGEEDRIHKSKKILSAAVIGLAIVFAGYFVAYMIIALLEPIK